MVVNVGHTIDKDTTTNKNGHNIVGAHCMSTHHI